VIDNLYMCVPGMESPFDRRVLPLYAEFVEHHVQLGVQHMFIAATYDLHGSNMRLLQGAFKSYIDDGLLTISSQAGDGQDFRYGFKGLTLDRDNIKVMFVNMCLFMAKGQADYVAIWDFDEFFIPKLPHNSIMDVVRFAEGSTPVPPPPPGEDIERALAGWQKGPGVADGDGHPFCYLVINSETINSDGDGIDPDHPWIGDRFSHGTEVTHLSFQKSILPTRKIFQAGLHIGGACKLPFPWNGCSEEETARTEFCYRGDKSQGVGALNKVSWVNSSYFVDFMRFHAFDEGTMVEDAKRLDIERDAIIYHIQAHRAHLVSNKAALDGPVNEYASRFFGKVLSQLEARGIALLQTLPLSHKRDRVTASAYWEPVIPLLDAKSFFPPGPKMLLPVPGEAVPSEAFWTPPQPLIPAVTAAAESGLASLPSFSADGLDYVLGSIIERAADSPALHLTAFLLGHDLLDPNKKGDLHGSRVADSARAQWVRFASHRWPERHKEPWAGKVPEQYSCRIKNSDSDSDSEAVPDQYYTVPAQWVPNKGTPDSGANRRLDIMRCAMRDTDAGYATLRLTAASVVVELLRDDVFLLRFSVPWASRKAGYTLGAPEGAGEGVSRLDAWKGADQLTRANASSAPGGGRDRLHMCVPGLESHLDKTSIPLYLEFIQHHLLLGVSHIHIGAAFSWGSASMARLRQLLAPFVRDGSVSLSSQAGDGIDDVYSAGGMSWFRDNSKIFFVNMCVYHAKGNADYVAIWDFDEFFIPKPPLRSLLDVVRAMEGPGGARYPAFPADAAARIAEDPLAAQRAYRGGAGLADGHMHPFCYIMLTSEVLANDNSGGGAFDYARPWVGQRFTHAAEADDKEHHMAFKKSIVPTDRVFQVGLHMHGACKLPPPWNGCGEGEGEGEGGSCFSKGSKQQQGISYTANGTLVDFSLTHSLDGTVWDGDAKKLSAEQGVIYHIQVNRAYLQASPKALRGEMNEYAKRFFPAVVRRLRERGYVLLEHFPEAFGSKTLAEAPADHLPWKPLFVEFLKKMRVRELFP
jgi:hypothetical protein